MADVGYDEFDRKEFYYIASGKIKLQDKNKNKDNLSLRDIFSQSNALTDNLGELDREVLFPEKEFQKK